MSLTRHVNDMALTFITYVQYLVVKYLMTNALKSETRDIMPPATDVDIIVKDSLLMRTATMCIRLGKVE